MKRFIQNWYLETEIRTQGNNDDLGVKEDAKQQADDLIKRVRDSTSLTAMAVNPLLLTMIATVHRRGSALPGRRVELYKEIFQVLLEKRQRAKNLHDLSTASQKQSVLYSLTASQKQSVLQGLALHLMQRKTRPFHLSEVNDLLLERLKMVLPHGACPDLFLKHIREVSGLLMAKEEKIYEFAHLSLQEYLGSVRISVVIPTSSGVTEAMPTAG